MINLFSLFVWGPQSTSLGLHLVLYLLSSAQGEIMECQGLNPGR